MNLDGLVNWASDKGQFLKVDDYIDFARHYLGFIDSGLQACIVSQNETQYRFLQYREDGHYNITRPLNADLMYTSENVWKVTERFTEVLMNARELEVADTESRRLIRDSIYTLQQCIGAALDALPAGASNKARKINGDLFERLIQLLVRSMGVDCDSGVVKIPIEIDGNEQFKMNYQHDLIIRSGEQVKAIGSVKTSSKDRIDKIFIDKFLFNRLTNEYTPHLAIFLNDVQRGKKSKRASGAETYRVSSTFLPGHFKGYTIKLNPLDGVYYCDIRPNMETDEILKKQISTIDHFFCSGLWEMLEKSPGVEADIDKNGDSQLQ